MKLGHSCLSYWKFEPEANEVKLGVWPLKCTSHLHFKLLRNRRFERMKRIKKCMIREYSSKHMKPVIRERERGNTWHDWGKESFLDVPYSSSIEKNRALYWKLAFCRDISWVTWTIRSSRLAFKRILKVMTTLLYAWCFCQLLDSLFVRCLRLEKSRYEKFIQNTQIWQNL